jgi:hypothetical protein
VVWIRKELETPEGVMLQVGIMDGIWQIVRGK